MIIIVLIVVATPFIDVAMISHTISKLESREAAVVSEWYPGREVDHAKSRLKGTGLGPRGAGAYHSATPNPFRTGSVNMSIGTQEAA